MTQDLSIQQHQQEQRDHPLYAVRVVVRGWGHPGYNWYAVTDDGGLLCFRCVHDNYRQIATDTLHGDGTGWQVIGLTNSGELEDNELCAHCGRTF